LDSKIRRRDRNNDLYKSFDQSNLEKLAYPLMPLKLNRKGKIREMQILGDFENFEID
jgi:hypothetical protein